MENNKKYNQDKSEKITKQDTIKIKTNQDTIERIKTKEEGGLKNEKKKTTRKTRKTV